MLSTPSCVILVPATHISINRHYVQHFHKQKLVIPIFLGSLLKTIALDGSHFDCLIYPITRSMVLNLPEADSDMSLRQALPSSLPLPSQLIPDSEEVPRRHTP